MPELFLDAAARRLDWQGWMERLELKKVLLEEDWVLVTWNGSDF